MDFPARTERRSDKFFTIRAKPRTSEMSGEPAPDISGLSLHQFAQSFPVVLPIEMIEDVFSDGDTDEKVWGVKSAIRKAFNSHHCDPTLLYPIVIHQVWAIWGGSYTELHSRNERETLDLVAKGSPWAYLVFDYSILRSDGSFAFMKYGSDGIGHQEPR